MKAVARLLSFLVVVVLVAILSGSPEKRVQSVSSPCFSIENGVCYWEER